MSQGTATSNVVTSQSSHQLEALRLLPSVWFRLLLPTSQRLVAAVAGGGAVAVGGDVAAVVPVVVAGQLPVRQLRLQQSCGRGGLPRPLWAGPH